MKAEDGRRKNPLIARFMKRHKLTPVRIEEDLTLHFSKDELFDHHVILPHSEVSPIVYEKVDQFTERYGGEHLNLTIYCGTISESSKQFFREAFILHYMDEYREATLSLYRCYLRVVMLALIGVITYYVGMHLESATRNLPFLITAIANISLFCIWEICNTDFKRRDAIELRKRIQRARDAEIRFH